MLAVAYDAKSLINVSIHVGAPLTDAEVDEILATIARQAAALKENPRARAISLIIVEAENAPDARQRRRIGEASKAITRGAQVLVTKSTLVRMVMTAIRWFSPANKESAHATCATYEEARAWLVANSSHPASVYDELLRQARARIVAASASRS